MNYKLPNKEIEVTDAELDALNAQREKNKEVRVRPKDQEYWFLEKDGEIDSFYFSPDSSLDEKIWSIGNGFFTEAEAIKERDIRLARQRIKDYIKKNKLEFTPDWGNTDQGKYSICYSHHPASNCFGVNYHNTDDDNNSFLFKSQEHVEQVIRDCEEDLKIVWGIK